MAEAMRDSCPRSYREPLDIFYLYSGGTNEEI